MQILIVKTSSLGDVVHNLPMVSDIQRHRPEVQVDWLVERAFADIPALHSGVRSVISVDLRRWLRTLGQGQTWRELRRFRERIQGRTYDMILDSQGLVKSALIARLARGPLYGPDRRSAREGLAAALYQHGIPMVWEQHAVWRNRSLGASALDYPLPHTPVNYGLRPPSLPRTRSGPFCVAFHATSRPSKLWPSERWITLGKTLADHGIETLLPSGNEQEQRAAQRIAQGIGAGAEALARMSVADLAGVIAGSRFAVGVDTGLVHLAAALNRPTVGIFCDSDPAQTGVLAEEGGAVNLGGFGVQPSVDDVLTGLRRLQALGGR